MKIIVMIWKIWLILALPNLFTPAPNSSGEKYPRPGNIRIGLLIQDNNSLAARQGAALAVDRANESGGKDGIRYELAVRSLEGPWGTGSKQAVSLIFEDSVCAIIGSTDGRNGHLVEQACTKTGVVFISSWAGDPTLAQAFIPWFFNCVPDDIRQAEILAENIYSEHKYRRVSILTDNNYDSKSILKYFLRKSMEYTSAAPLVTDRGEEIYNRNRLAGNITEDGTECLLLLCNNHNASEMIRELKKRNINIPVYGAASLSNENDQSLKEIRESGITILIPSVTWNKENLDPFTESYFRRYGTRPGLSASLTYDAVNMLIEATRDAGTDREKIQEYLIKVNYDGVTGSIGFDERGNRRGTTSIMNIKEI